MEREAGSRLGNAALLAGLGLAAVLQPAACDAPGGRELPEESVGLALAPVGGLIERELRQFAEDLDQLDASLSAWEAALQTGAAEAELDVARADYLLAMGTWQRLELLQVGPSGSSLIAVGGEDLRDEVYSWPDAVSGCQVDVETVDAQWSSADFFSTRLVHSYGLDALEHLLFAPLTTTCPSQVGINDTWDALGGGEILARRATFARALTQHAGTLAIDLAERWSADLSTALVEGTAPWASRSEALDEVFSALFYIELTTKDRKLAEPLGIRECTVECTSLVESRTTGHSVAWVVQNLEALRDVTAGGPDDGFDALLESLGHGDIAVALDVAIADAITVATDLEEQPLDELITTDPAAVTALHDAVKRITDILRGDFATVLLLEIPGEAAGDND